MLQFYSYYKQATQGACDIARPAFWDVVGKAKWCVTQAFRTHRVHPNTGRMFCSKIVKRKGGVLLFGFLGADVLVSLVSHTLAGLFLSVHGATFCAKNCQCGRFSFRCCKIVRPRGVLSNLFCLFIDQASSFRKVLLKSHADFSLVISSFARYSVPWFGNSVKYASWCPLAGGAVLTGARCVAGTRGRSWATCRGTRRCANTSSSSRR